MSFAAGEKKRKREDVLHAGCPLAENYHIHASLIYSCLLNETKIERTFSKWAPSGGTVSLYGGSHVTTESVDWGVNPTGGQGECWRSTAIS